MGTINGCRAALRVMKPRGAGKIVNVASLGGIVPMSGEAIYSATKAAIRYYTLSLAAELHDFSGRYRRSLPRFGRYASARLRAAA